MSVLASTHQEQGQAEHQINEVQEQEAGRESAFAGLPSQSLALMRAPLAGAQRQNIVARMGQQYGNRQLQRILNTVQTPMGGHPTQIEEEPTQPIGGNPEQEEFQGGTSTRSNFLGSMAQSYGILGGAVQRTIGDGHDLTNQRFSGNTLLEAVFDNERVLRLGSATDEFRGVSSVQLALQDLGHLVPKFGIDGIFGAETVRAVKAFQKKEGIAVDGVVGPDTMGHLDTKAPNGTAPVKPAAPAAGGAVTIDPVTTGGPAFTDAGHFHWRIRWNHNATNGFIVQEITNTYNAQNPDGSANTGVQPTPHYFEAWQVDAAGAITDIATSEGTDDYWIRPRNPNTRGSWSMDANVFFAPSLDPAAGFGRGAAGGAPDAGDLFATTTKPANLSPLVSTRRNGGKWNNTNGNNTHDPA